MPISTQNYKPVAGIERTGPITDRPKNSIPRAPAGPVPSKDWSRWTAFATCRNADSELFFGRDYERGRERTDREGIAKSYCGRCPVVASCLEWALANSESGIWAGTTEEERTALKRRASRERLKAGASA